MSIRLWPQDFERKDHIIISAALFKRPALARRRRISLFFGLCPKNLPNFFTKLVKISGQIKELILQSIHSE